MHIPILSLFFLFQSDVSHEIIRPTPRRAGLAASSPTRSGPSPNRSGPSPTRGLIGSPAHPAYIVSVGGTGLAKYSPYNRWITGSLAVSCPILNPFKYQRKSEIGKEITTKYAKLKAQDAA